MNIGRLLAFEALFLAPCLLSCKGDSGPPKPTVSSLTVSWTINALPVPDGCTSFGVDEVVIAFRQAGVDHEIETKPCTVGIATEVAWEPNAGMDQLVGTAKRAGAVVDQRLAGARLVNGAFQALFPFRVTGGATTDAAAEDAGSDATD